MDERFIRHSHAPAHLFRPGAVYCLTARSYLGFPIMASSRRREKLLSSLHFAARQRGWDVLAWVVLSNHYHALLGSPEQEAESLSTLVNAVHRYTARLWNTEDGCPGRAVWYQFWDTCVPSEAGLFARLNYLHYNPVKHGLVAAPEAYPHSSYRRFCEDPHWDMPALEALYGWDLLDLEG